MFYKSNDFYHNSGNVNLTVITPPFLKLPVPIFSRKAQLSLLSKRNILFTTCSLKYLLAKITSRFHF